MKRFFCFMKKVFSCDNNKYKINTSKQTDPRVNMLGKRIVSEELSV